MSKKIISVLLAAVMMFAFAACSKGGSNEEVRGEDGIKYDFVFKNDGYDTVKFGKPEKSVNPADVYKSVKYDEKMFFGRHTICGYFSPTLEVDKNENVKKYVDELATKGTMKSPTNENDEITILPTGFEAGRATPTFVYVYDRDNSWMTLTYLKDGEYPYNVHAIYEVKDNNTLVIKPATEMNYDKDKKKFTYTLTGTTLEYGFEFKGFDLVLTKDGQSVTLTSVVSDDNDERRFHIDNYHTPNTPKIDNIEAMRLHCDDNTDLYVSEKIFGDGYYDSIAGVTKDGLFTMTVPYEQGTKTYQYAFFYCGNDGIILSDGNTNYYYNDTYAQRNSDSLMNSISSEEMKLVEDLSESKVEDIAKTKNELLDDLIAAFEAQGINVAVNKETGELAMDASVLFGGDSADLTNDGKDFLKKFMTAYTEIACNDKYSSFIKKTLVEGHAAPVDGVTFDEALPFSEKRAKAVMDYCLSKEIGVDTSKLNKKMEIKGCSNGTPVLNNDGSVNFDASRRVSFRFLIDIENVK